jgi:hypothetical protein
MAIDEPLEVHLEGPDWRFPILEWLVEGKLPSDQMEAQRIVHRAKAFVLIDGELEGPIRRPERGGVNGSR